MKTDYTSIRIRFASLALFTLIMFAHGLVHAVSARAQWRNSSELLINLAQGLRVTSDMRFFISDGAMPFRQSQNVIELPLISSGSHHALVSTAHINHHVIDTLIRGPLKAVVTNGRGETLDSMTIQYAGLLDHLYYYEGNDLGPVAHHNEFSLKLWAPTARQVRLFIYSSPDANPQDPQAILPMDRENGIWKTYLPRSYENFFYLYEVEVFQPLTGQMELSLATDPYSRSLAMNSAKSQIVNIDSEQLKPSGWDHLTKPVLHSLVDSVIYELHIRDFSSLDATVPFYERGTYSAFTQDNSLGMQHLKSLAEAGLTHIHLLPFNDFGSVNENKSLWQNYHGRSSYLEEPQSIIGQIRSEDPFNWGYDPVHYFTPDGSYASDPHGGARIKEVRQMIQSLNKSGLRVVQDVVFNHTYNHALEKFSVFDRIVPLYYYRVNEEGLAHKSSCCADTASEHRMMEKLIIDSVIYWAKTYKLDGFRFDLMSFHSKQTMSLVRDSLRSLTVEKDGVDGSKLLLYGEGWEFGSLYDRHADQAATAVNSYGLDIGFFNDRIRDAVRGGTTNSSEKSDQGFVTGLYFDFNREPANRNTPTHLEDQKMKLLHLGDVIKVGLAGNLKDYRFREHLGSSITGGQLRFRGTQVGTAASPTETINYVSAHDGYTLWDAIQAKAPFFNPERSPAMASITEKQRMHHLALALPLLGQGIPFIESGLEILRSKNGDQDSYDSGDFFNSLDFSLRDNGWGRGLPPAWKNYYDWTFWQPRLTEPAMAVSAEEIVKTKNYFKALLRLRKSSSLFRLQSQEEISQKLQFLDANQPGLIAMLLTDQEETLLVLFNASKDPRTFTHSVFTESWDLHPMWDPTVDSALAEVAISKSYVSIPGRSTVVLKKMNKVARP